MTNVLTALFDTLNLICYTFTFLTRESMFTERVRTATAFLFTLHYILRNAERWQQMLSTVIVSWNWKIKPYIDIYILWVVARVLLWGCLLAEDSPVNCSEGSFGSCFRPVRFGLSSHVDICTQTEEIQQNKPSDYEIKSNEFSHGTLRFIQPRLGERNPYFFPSNFFPNYPLNTKALWFRGEQRSVFKKWFGTLGYKRLYFPSISFQTSIMTPYKIRSRLYHSSALTLFWFISENSISTVLWKCFQ